MQDLFAFHLFSLALNFVRYGIFSKKYTVVRWHRKSEYLKIVIEQRGSIVYKVVLHLRNQFCCIWKLKIFQNQI